MNEKAMQISILEERKKKLVNLNQTLKIELDSKDEFIEG